MPTNPLHPPLLPCIWMEAGVIGYKLCDRSLQCDSCPFDVLMRAPRSAERSEVASTPEVNTGSFSRKLSPEEVLTMLFAPFDQMNFPDDRSYAPGHMWVKRGDELLTVGADHVAAELVAPVTGIVLPRQSSSVRRDAQCCWMLHDDTAVSLFSPVSGSVHAVNTTLNTYPARITSDPYHDGWILEIQPRRGDIDFETRSSSEHRAIVESELRNLRLQLSSLLNKRPRVTETLLDGGRVVDSIVALVGQRVFFDLISPLLRPNR